MYPASDQPERDPLSDACQAVPICDQEKKSDMKNITNPDITPKYAERLEMRSLTKEMFLRKVA